MRKITFHRLSLKGKYSYQYSTLFKDVFICIYIHVSGKSIKSMGMRNSELKILIICGRREENGIGVPLILFKLVYMDIYYIIF